MLTKFSVTNFKGFNEEFVFDLNETNNYEFNKSCLKNGVVNNALIYGHNGIGKSNLGFAIFDIVGQLTDNKTNKEFYNNYLNASSSLKTARFYYKFVINNNVVEYTYEKINFNTIIKESFFINGVLLAFINRELNMEAEIYFKGAESLKTSLSNENLSLLKYIRNNSELDENKENLTFKKTFKFVEGMLFFRTLQNSIFIGLEEGQLNLQDNFIKKGYVPNFELFLNKAGIICKLNIKKVLSKDIIVFDFNGITIPFLEIASAGTLALTHFYYWLQIIKKESIVSLLYIDEFDAFYHHSLSALIVEELKLSGVQFILTSHNTSIITNDILRPDCYFLMYKNAIKSLAKRTSKELREAHNIEKMYKAGSFNE